MPILRPRRASSRPHAYRSVAAALGCAVLVPLAFLGFPSDSRAEQEGVAHPPSREAAPTPDRCPLDVPSPPATPTPAGEVPEPAWDLRCIALLPTAQAPDALGVLTIGRPPSPFAVTVTADGRHVHRLASRVEGLPDPASLGPYAAYVAWATPFTFERAVRLGEVRNGSAFLGEVDFPKYLVLITAEASADVEERSGPLVLRGRSPSSRMEAHDLLATAPGAVSGGHAGAVSGEHAGAVSGEHAGAVSGAHHAPGNWRTPPTYPEVPMLPGIMALRPGLSPLSLPAAEDIAGLPEARPAQRIHLGEGGTLDLEAGWVRRTLGGRELAMLAFNGQHPGPLVEVAANTTIFVNFRNDTPFSTAVHWHGVRLDNRFDGVPGVTQDPVPPGGSFRYTVHFPDAGIYWYHPHHREDVQQELGLAGNLLVREAGPVDGAQIEPPRVNREEILLLDDLLIDEEGVLPFGDTAATHALMGRFGTMALVNGEPEATIAADRGEVVRFYLTNASNTRTWNLSLRPVGGDGAATDRARPGTDSASLGPAPRSVLPMKVVATDIGPFEREAFTESVVLAPAERYVVDVRFPEAGTYVLSNRVLGINHRQGVFLPEEMRLARVVVSDRPADPDHARAFASAREHAPTVADIDRYRDRFDAPIDREIVLALEAEGVPDLIEQSMRFDRAYFHPVEWTGTMPLMNWATTTDRVRWTIREPATGRRDMDIAWRFRVGDVVKIRVHNDRASLHAMQHPLHVHGQRFLVIAQDGVPVENRAWKDTVLLPAGSVTDILLELSNPGRWMVHCHIAEHLEAGMKFVFEVEEREP